MDLLSPDTSENGEGLDADADEALSLSDLPLIHQSRIRVGDEVTSLQHIESLQDFDFCALSTDSEMCAADELFFRGQILPLRPCSSDGLSVSTPRSQSTDSRDSGGSIPSRSSSINSRQSSSSCSSADKPLKKPLVNPFHWHPSPSPKLPQQKLRQHINNQNCRNKSMSRLRLITTPPKIEFQNPKTRTTCRNPREKKKKKKGKMNLLSGCDCKLDAVADTVPSQKKRNG